MFFKVGTCLVALLCMFSIFSISPTLNGDQTASAYSSDGEKDIGVFVDENLSFNKHIQNQVNKANSIMGLIRRTIINIIYYFKYFNHISSHSSILQSGHLEFL
jgi:hypothetical protein